MSCVAKVNIILLGLITLTSLLIVWLQQSTEPKDVPSLTDKDPNKVQDIYLRRVGFSDIHLQKQNHVWVMLKPQKTMANQVRVKAVLSLLTAPVFSHFTLDIKRLDEFALNPPKISLTFDQTEIQMGAIQPINHLRYFRIERDIYLLQDNLPHILLGSVSSFIQHVP